MLLLFGWIPLFNVMTRPRFEGYYRPDVLALIAGGMCLGAAIALIATALRDTRMR